MARSLVMEVSAPPIELRTGSASVRLKWHQLRRRLEDPPFVRGNLLEGLAAGASLEVDLRPLACGSFVCLHDPELDSETTGSGAVADADADCVRELRMKGSGEPLLLLDELVEIVRRAPHGPGALVQLDLQSDRVELRDVAVARFADAFRGSGEGFVLSSYDFAMVERLAGGVAALRLGYDPTRDAVDGGGDLESLVRDVAPGADTVYLHRAMVRAAVERGDSLVARLRERGHRVDCWTIDHGRSDAQAFLAAAIQAGCDQVTTNTAQAWVAAPPWSSP